MFLSANFSCNLHSITIFNKILRKMGVLNTRRLYLLVFFSSKTINFRFQTFCFIVDRLCLQAADEGPRSCKCCFQIYPNPPYFSILHNSEHIPTFRKIDSLKNQTNIMILLLNDLINNMAAISLQATLRINDTNVKFLG